LEVLGGGVNKVTTGDVIRISLADWRATWVCLIGVYPPKKYDFSRTDQFEGTFPDKPRAVFSTRNMPSELYWLIGIPYPYSG
jgi:hypothetical protein